MTKGPRLRARPADARPVRRDWSREPEMGGLVGPAAVESSKVDWRWRLQAPGIARGYWTPDVPLVLSEVRERGISENN